MTTNTTFVISKAGAVSTKTLSKYFENRPYREIAMSSAVRVFVVFFIACAPIACCWAAPLPRTVLILDQSGQRLSAYAEISENFRATISDNSSSHISVYEDELDLSVWQAPPDRHLLEALLRAKYRDVALGVLVAIGARALEYALLLRSGDWSTVPIVFVAVADATIVRSALPAAVTGRTVQSSLNDFAGAARALVPDLKRLALVGDPIERQTYRSHFKNEISKLASNLELIDLTGLPMADLMKRVSALPADSAIAYTTINVDGDGKSFTPRQALKAIAGVANRPVVVDVETHIGHGATGGFVVRPAIIGQEAAKLVLRLFNGESASQIPILLSDATAPIFDWRQMQRWGISEAQLPAGSEVRFRGETFWRRNSWQIVFVGFAFVLQTALILALLYEDRHRRRAELSANELRSELAHIDRVATAGELAAMIAHEIRQPLTALVTNGNAGLRWLRGNTPNLDEARAALKSIVSEGHRASQILDGVRALFRTDRNVRTSIDINNVTRKVLSLAAGQVTKYDVGVTVELSHNLRPQVDGVEVQLHQVILNLIVNAIDSMKETDRLDRHLWVRTAVRRLEQVVVTVEDSGPGIDPKDIDSIFKPFFTTKPHGMGMGLSICKSIVEAHGGQLTAMPGRNHGALFQIVLPYERAASS